MIVIQLPDRRGYLELFLNEEVLSVPDPKDGAWFANVSDAQEIANLLCRKGIEALVEVV